MSSNLMDNKSMQDFQVELEAGLRDFLNDPGQVRSIAEACKNLGFNFAGDEDETDLECLMVPDENTTTDQIDPIDKLLHGQKNIISKLDNISRAIGSNNITLDTIFETKPMAISVLSITSLYALYCLYKRLRR